MAETSIPGSWVPPCPHNLPDRELIQTVRVTASLPDDKYIGELTGLTNYKSSLFFKIAPTRYIRKLRLTQKHTRYHQTKITQQLTISVQRHQTICRKPKDTAALKAKLVPRKTIKRRPQDTGLARWRLSKKVRRRENIKRCYPYLICWAYRHHGYGLIAEYGETPYLSLLIGFILERTELSTRTQPILNTAKQRQIEAESPNEIVWRDLMELDSVDPQTCN